MTTVLASRFETRLYPARRRSPEPSRLAIGTTDAHCAVADGLFGAMLVTPLLPKIPRIGQSIPIVAETEQIADRRNSREIKSAIF
ncbi:MAG: hypothetical protein JOZ35_16165 [Hyphomicrobiales bacterium]|nr:hypothetical protein [Hyphomicrobiales bacterium]